MSRSKGVTQRRLCISIAAVTLLIWAVGIGILQLGGRPDPRPLRAEAMLINSGWRFRTGDDIRWSSANTDARDWGTIDLAARPGSHDGDVGLPDYVSGWMAHGHPGYAGYAWYRRVVSVPRGRAMWAILGPTLVEDGYQIYWNGQLLGGSGSLGMRPRVVSTRPLQFALPLGVAGTRGVLAIRVFMLPRPTPSTEGGGLHSAPILAPRLVADGLHRVQWERTIAGYIADAIEPLAMFLLVGLMLWSRPAGSRRGFVIFASVALILTAARRLNNPIVAWTDLMDLPTYSFLAKFMWMPAVAAWTLSWNRWTLRPWRTIDAAAIAIMIAEIVGAVTDAASVSSVSRIASIVVFLVMGLRIARTGPIRGLALVSWALVTLAFFGDELLDPLGIPGIWFPFGIGVSRTQYIYAILIPLLGFLIVRSLEDDLPVPACHAGITVPPDGDGSHNTRLCQE